MIKYDADDLPGMESNWEASADYMFSIRVDNRQACKVWAKEHAAERSAYEKERNSKPERKAMFKRSSASYYLRNKDKILAKQKANRLAKKRAAA